MNSRDPSVPRSPTMHSQPARLAFGYFRLLVQQTRKRLHIECKITPVRSVSEERTF